MAQPHEMDLVAAKKKGGRSPVTLYRLLFNGLPAWLHEWQEFQRNTRKSVKIGGIFFKMMNLIFFLSYNPSISSKESPVT